VSYLPVKNMPVKRIAPTLRMYSLFYAMACGAISGESGADPSRRLTTALSYV
jgi:hypothetical protein